MSYPTAQQNSQGNQHLQGIQVQASHPAAETTPPRKGHPIYRIQQHMAALTPPKKEVDRTSLFVAIGLDANEPGHRRIAETVQSLGPYTPYHESLWRVNSLHGLDKAFKQINTSMIDRRIDGTAGLLMIDPNAGYVKWHLRRPISDMLKGCWPLNNNLFISFTLQNPAANYDRVMADVRALGLAAPIGKSIWYASSTYSSKEAFRILISSMDSGDELVVFDERGTMALWHDGHSQAAQAYRQQMAGYHPKAA